MNRVEISETEIPPPARSGQRPLRIYVRRALKRLAKRNWSVSILLCDDSRIQELNRTYRAKDSATDVLSFPQADVPMQENGPRVAGDIVISKETMIRNARSRDESIDSELKRLIVHGLLHLDGMDHDDSNVNDDMLVLQESLLVKLPKKRIIAETWD